MRMLCSGFPFASRAKLSPDVRIGATCCRNLPKVTGCPSSGPRGSGGSVGRPHTPLYSDPHQAPGRCWISSGARWGIFCLSEVRDERRTPSPSPLSPRKAVAVAAAVWRSPMRREQTSQADATFVARRRTVSRALILSFRHCFACTAKLLREVFQLGQAIVHRKHGLRIVDVHAWSEVQCRQSRRKYVYET